MLSYCHTHGSMRDSSYNFLRLAYSLLWLQLKSFLIHKSFFSAYLKNRFKNIRTVLNKEEKKMKLAKSGSSGGLQTKWKLYEHAKFLVCSLDYYENSLISSSLGMVSKNWNLYHIFSYVSTIFYASFLK